jgi:large subunit ribosomal protein L20
MVRVKRGNVAAKRRKKYLKCAKGYVGSNSRLSTMIGEQVTQSLNFAYQGRKAKKRNFRRIWISRINALSRARINNYSKFMGALHKVSIFLDRKILSFIGFYDILSFNLLERKSRL